MPKSKTNSSKITTVQRKVLAAIEEMRPESCQRADDPITRQLQGGGLLIKTPGDLAPLIDHTLLKPDATEDAIEALCREAAIYRFAAVCVNPYWVPYAHEHLEGTSVAVAAVVGFPLGATLTSIKALETEAVVAAGADEVDMVINIGQLKAERYAAVFEDIRAVVVAAHEKSAHVKVIIEAALLTEDEKIAACIIAQTACAEFVKTSTGFGPGGATVEDVALMRAVVGYDMGVKAAGGIRDFAKARAMVDAGASRLGASAGLKIIGADSGQ